MPKNFSGCKSLQEKKKTDVRRIVTQDEGLSKGREEKKMSGALTRNAAEVKDFFWGGGEPFPQIPSQPSKPSHSCDASL